MPELTVYLSLFATAFMAATVLPAQSEAMLASLLLTGNYPVGQLLIAASSGNVLGSLVNWILGRAIGRLRDRPWFPASQAALERAQRWYHRYGKWSLLLSWVPVVGDPLTVVAGVLREPLTTFLVLVTIAKVTRYVVLCAIILQAMPETGIA